MKKKRDVFFVRQIAAADTSDQQPCQVSLAIVKGGEYTIDIRSTGRNLNRVRLNAEEAFRQARQFVRQQKKAAEREHEQDTRERLERSVKKDAS